MKRILIILLLVAAAVLVYKKFFEKKNQPEKKLEALAVSKHSSAFNTSMQNVLNAYFDMKEGFTNWDSAQVTAKANLLETALTDFKVEDLKKDSAIYQTVLFPLDNAKQSVNGILSAKDWAEKRRALHDLSDNLRMILLTVKYDQAVVYWQECPMAFGENQSGNWLSNTEKISNPYLGNKSPQYGASMLECGETKTVIDFTKADSVINH